MKALSNVRVGTRLGGSYGLLLFMMVLTFTGLNRMALLHLDLDNIAQQDLAQIDLAGTMRDAVRFQAVALRDVVMQEDFAFKKKELKLMKEARKKYLVASESLEKVLPDTQGKAFLA